jgi:hypothetical protein
MRSRLRVAWLLAAALLAGAALGGSAVRAAQAGLVNARVETRSAAGGLEPAVRAVLAGNMNAWIGYHVPIERRGGSAMRDSGWCCGRCRLEPPAELTVLARVEMGAVARLRATAVDCDLDAGGMPVVWLTDVQPDQSIAWLATFVTNPQADGNKLPPLAASALAAIGQHRTQAAVPLLVGFARDGSRAVRGQAMFWLGQSSDPRALDFLEKTLLK